MRIVRYKKGTVLRYGVLEDDTIRDIEGDVFGDWKLGRSETKLAMVRLLAPVDPPNIICIGLNYRKHAEESKLALPEEPVVFIKTTNALSGPGDEIVLPEVAPDEVDYEAELAMVVGKKMRGVRGKRVFDHVLGYTCANDVSARDLQMRRDKQWARGKSLDGFCPVGPWIETDIDPGNVEIQLRLNGKVMQSSSTSDMIFSCQKLLEFLNCSMTLYPGTLILTGTPHGVGFARKPPVFLRPGDTVEIEVEGIGVLANSVTGWRGDR